MNKIPTIFSSDIPFITVEQMKKVDQLMINKYKISLLQMMENASLQLAHLSRVIFPNNKKFIVLVGKGNNGGGGLGAARRLHNWSFEVVALLASKRNEFKSIPKKQLEIIDGLDIEIIESEDEYQKIFDNYSSDGVVIDALLGYSMKGNPRENYATQIELANNSKLPIISLDIPSGIEGTKGEIYTPAIKANATLTLALPKTGFLNKKVKKYIGQLFVADISVPPKLYSDLGLNVQKTLFQNSSIIEIKEK
ncbi:MAG: NAD(P)H-hydrate epimerase [Candidatus Heimdallarchaeota archaeon]